MPQATSPNQTDGGQDYQADSKDPIAFIYQHRKRLNNMDPDKAVKFVDRMFKRYALPKYQQVNKQRPLDEDESERLRLQFAARMFDLPLDQKTLLKDIEGKNSDIPYMLRAKEAFEKTGKEIGSAVTGGMAGVLGGSKKLAELAENLSKHGGKSGQGLAGTFGKMKEGFGRSEKTLYDKSKSLSPERAIPEISAGIGHQYMPAVLSGGVGAGAGISEGANPIIRAGQAAAKGYAEGTAFESAKEGKPTAPHTPGDVAGWTGFGVTGELLKGAFPLLGKMFGLGRRVVPSEAPEAAKAVVSQEGATAGAASSESSTMGGIADKAAKKKFGKAFKDLTSAEKAQMPEAMKEEIKAQQAVKQANKKAEVAAAKAGREAEETAKRAVKAEAATAKAAKQAAKRAVVPAATPVAKQAVAAQAATENPSIAKTLGGVQAGPLKDVTGPDPIRQARIRELENLAKTGTDTEKSYAESALKDMKENPFESGATLGEDIRKARAKEGTKPVTKLSPEETGPKVRAKSGQPASPAQQAADRERIAKKRELSKGEEFGSALEKHAQEMAGRHTAGSIGMMHIPELEDTMKEFPNGELFLKGFQKLRKAGRITDEIYTHEMIEWLKTQFEAAP